MTILKGSLVSINGMAYYLSLSSVNNCLKASFFNRNGQWKEILEEETEYCNHTTESIIGAVTYTQSACPFSESDYC